MFELINAVLLATVDMLCQEGNYLRAAQRLGMTTSLLKEQVATLEDQLEFRMFKSHEENVTITEEGRIFLNAYRAFLRQTRGTKSQGSPE